MTGKARSNNESFEAYQLRQNAKFENLLAQNTNIDHGQFFTSAPPQRDLRTFLNKEFGGVMGSPIGYNPSVVGIVSGIIDIGRSSGKLSPHVIIQAETGTTDTLTDIQNFVFGYQDLTIQADTGDTITISTGGTTGSDIFLGNNITNVTLNSTEQLQLRYDTISNRWATFIDTTSGGSSGVSFPITPTINILGTVTTSQDINLSLTTAHSTSMTLGADISITFSNYPTSGTQIEWELEITQDSIGSHIITWPTEVVNPPTLSITAADSITVIVFRTNDGGTTVRVSNTVTTTDSGSGADWSNNPAVADVNFAGFSSTNMSSLTMSGDINVNTFDVLQIDRATFANDGSSITGNTIAQMVLNSSSSLQTNVNTGFNFVWTILNETILTVENDVSNNGVLTVQSLDDTGGAAINVFRNDVDGGVPSALTIGSYGFETGTSTVSTTAEYASIQGIAETVTAGTFEGSLDLLAGDGSGGQAVFLSINDGANNLVDIFKELDMNGNNIIAGGATEGMTNIGHLDFVDNTATPVADLSIYSDGTDLLANTGGSTVNLSNISTGAATTELDNLGTTAVNADINMGSNSVTFNPNTVLIGSPSSTILNIQFPTGSEQLRLLWNTSTTPTTEWAFTSDTLTGGNIILENTLIINNSSTDPDENGMFSRNGPVLGLQIPSFKLQTEQTGTFFGELTLLKIDPDPSDGEPIYQIDFNVVDTTSTKTYAQIEGRIQHTTHAGTLEFNVMADDLANVNAITIEGDEDITNRTYLTINSIITSNFLFGNENSAGGTFKIGPDPVPGAGANTILGLVVQDNVDFTVGTEGTLSMPVINGTPPLSDAAMESDFGTHIGSHGMYVSTTSTVVFVIKAPDTHWYGVSMLRQTTS